MDDFRRTNATEPNQDENLENQIKEGERKWKKELEGQAVRNDMKPPSESCACACASKANQSIGGVSAEWMLSGLRHDSRTWMDSSP